MNKSSDLLVEDHYSIRLLQYSDIYSTTNISENLLASICKRIHIDELNEVLIFLLNNIDFFLNQDLEKSIIIFFKNNNLKHLSKVKTIINKIKNTNKNALFVNNIIYNIIEFSVQNYDWFNNSKCNNKRVIINSVFDLILIFNEEHLIEQNEKESNYSNSDEDKIKLVFAKSMSLYDVSNINIGQTLMAEVIKNVELVKYIKGSKYSKLSDKFAESLGYPSLKDLYSDYGGIIAAFHSNGKTDPLKGTNYLEEGNLKIDNLIKIFCINSHDQLEFLEDYVNLRQYPMYNFDSRKVAIISDYFAIQKFYKSIIIEFNNWLKGISQHKNLRSDLKKDIDEYFLDYTLKKIISNPYSLNEEEIKQNSTKNEGLPDYLYIDNDIAILFESKHIDLIKEAKCSLEFDSIYKELFLKSDRFSKANKQLLNNIERISNDKLLKKKFYCQNFYPIIVTHSRIYDCLGFNYFVKNEFEKERMKYASLSTLNINPPIVINIETLLVYRDNIIDKNYLIELLNSYLVYVDNFNASRGTNFLNSFDWFVNNHFNIKGKVPKWGHVLDKFSEVYSVK